MKKADFKKRIASFVLAIGMLASTAAPVWAEEISTPESAQIITDAEENVEESLKTGVVNADGEIFEETEKVEEEIPSLEDGKISTAETATGESAMLMSLFGMNQQAEVSSEDGIRFAMDVTESFDGSALSGVTRHTDATTKATVYKAIRNATSSNFMTELAILTLDNMSGTYTGHISVTFPDSIASKARFSSQENAHFGYVKNNKFTQLSQGYEEGVTGDNDELCEITVSSDVTNVPLDAYFVVTWEETELANIFLNEGEENSDQFKTYQGKDYGGYTDSFNTGWHAWSGGDGGYATLGGDIPVYRHFDNVDGVEIEPHEYLSQANINVMRCSDVNENLRVDGYTIKGAYLVRRDLGVSPLYALRWWHRADGGQENGKDRFMHYYYRTEENLNDIVTLGEAAQTNAEIQTAKDAWLIYENGMPKTPRAIHLYYAREQVEATGDLKLIDNIVLDGTIKAEFAVRDKAQENHYYFKWFKKDDGATEFAQIPYQYAQTIDVAKTGGSHAMYYAEMWQVTEEGTEKVYVSDVYTVPYYTSLQNGGFENILAYPALMNKIFKVTAKGWGDKGWNAQGNQNYTPGFSGSMQFEQLSNVDLGWKTTGLGKYCNRTGKKGNLVGMDIEILHANATKEQAANWSASQKFHSSTYQNYGIAAMQNGMQCAELSCETVGVLYQDLLTVPGEVLSWSASHAARSRGLSVTNGGLDTSAQDAMAVIIMDAMNADDYMFKSESDGDIAQEDFGKQQIDKLIEAAYVANDNALLNRLGGTKITSNGLLKHKFQGMNGIYGNGELDENGKEQGIKVTVEHNGKEYSATVWLVISGADWQEFDGYSYIPTLTDDPTTSEHLTRFMFAGVATYDGNDTTGNLVDAVAAFQLHEDIPGSANLIVKKNVTGVDASDVIPAGTFKFNVTQVGMDAVEEISLPTVDATVNDTAAWSVIIPVQMDSDSSSLMYKVDEVEPDEYLPGYSYYKYDTTTATVTPEANHFGAHNNKEAICMVHAGMDTTVTVENSYSKQTSELTVKKTVEGTENNEDFSFTLTLTGSQTTYDKNISGLLFESDDDQVGKPIDIAPVRDPESGKISYPFTLKDGEKVALTIPSGFSAIVTESSEGLDYYNTSFELNGTMTGGGIGTTTPPISTNSDTTVTFTNSYIPPFGTLTIRKVVRNNDSETRAFDFSLILENNGTKYDGDLKFESTNQADTRTSLKADADSKVYSFSLKNQDEIKITIPAGYKATVTENLTGVENYTAKLDEGDGVEVDTNVWTVEALERDGAKSCVFFNDYEEAEDPPATNPPEEDKPPVIPTPPAGGGDGDGEEEDKPPAVKPTPPPGGQGNNQGSTSQNTATPTPTPVVNQTTPAPTSQPKISPAPFVPQTGDTFPLEIALIVMACSGVIGAGLWFYHGKDEDKK